MEDIDVTKIWYIALTMILLLGILNVCSYRDYTRKCR